MNVTLQRHFAKCLYVVPEGLLELMSDISREVLRSLPSDIYTFVADYLDALLITRENARVAARLINEIIEISETTRQILEKTGLMRAEAEHAAKVIQGKFRQYLEKHNPKDPFDHEPLLAEILADSNIPMEHAEAAALVIQRATKTFLYMRKQERMMYGDEIDWKIAARSTIALYRKTGVTEDDLQRAATLIKSAYKGYYARKNKKKLLNQLPEVGSEECVCESYSLELPSVKKPSTVESAECVCSVGSEDLVLGKMNEDECLCQYTVSEQIFIGKGEKTIPEDDHIVFPSFDVESRDDRWCYCENNLTPEVKDKKEEMAEPVEINNAEDREDDVISALNF